MKPRPGDDRRLRRKRMNLLNDLSHRGWIGRRHHHCPGCFEIQFFQHFRAGRITDVRSKATRLSLCSRPGIQLDHNEGSVLIAD